VAQHLQQAPSPARRKILNTPALSEKKRLGPDDSRFTASSPKKKWAFFLGGMKTKVFGRSNCIAVVVTNTIIS
jgi:hypothetical protein